MERYDVFGPDWSVEPWPDGYYVTYDDAQKAIKEARIDSQVWHYRQGQRDEKERIRNGYNDILRTLMYIVDGDYITIPRHVVSSILAVIEGDK